MVAADTSRSRAYLQSLAGHDLLPNYVLVLEDITDESLPGQLDNFQLGRHGEHVAVIDECWSEAHFDLTQPIKILLGEKNIPYEVFKSTDINDPSIVTAIRGRPESVFIYSGFGGVLLRKDVLATKKKFLHVHGGYIPEFKGSTTNYYSLILENTLGASAIFLTEEIDGGPKHEGLD